MNGVLQLSSAQCFMNSGGPIASGACVASAHWLPTLAQRGAAGGSTTAGENAAAATGLSAFWNPRDAARLTDKTRWQQASIWIC